MTKTPPEFWRSALTDRQDEFDTGRILVPIAVLALILLTAVDVYLHGRAFDAQSFGAGIGLILSGFAAYLWGDNRGVPPGGKS